MPQSESQAPSAGSPQTTKQSPNRPVLDTAPPATAALATAALADAGKLNGRFGISGVAAFDTDRGLTRLRLTAPAGNATLYLQGAHITDWQPAGHEPVLFMSSLSPYAPGKPFRGGIPIVFPWFSNDTNPTRVDGHPGPTHGFARLQDWTFESLQRAGDGVSVRLSLPATDLSRSMGFDHFLLTLEATFADTFSLAMTVSNAGTRPLSFEEGFHTYFRVHDIHEASVTGLEATGYLDKVDHGAPKPASGEPITFPGPVDRVYLHTEAACTVRDGALHREIRMRKMNSHSTVVWNPGKPVTDIGEWDWHEMLALETSNVNAEARTLAPGESFRMAMQVAVNKLPAR